MTNAVLWKGGWAHNADMAIDRRDFLIGTWLQKLAGDDFLHCQHHTILTPDADSCSSILDCLHSVLYLWGLVSHGGSRGPIVWSMPRDKVVRTWKFRPSGEKTELERS